MLDTKVLPLIRQPLQLLARGSRQLGLTADQVTLAGFGLGLGAAALVMLGQPLWALALLLLNRLSDGIDGELARLTRPTDAGAYLDIILDFIFYNLFVLAFIIWDPASNALAGAVLMLSFMGTGGSFLAFAALAGPRGIKNPAYPTKSLHYMGGLTEGTETIITFVLFCLFPAFFAELAYIFATLCLLTTFSRVVGGYRALR